ncbi:hypothetical protein JW935_04130 [candidate division KSB1 bacterium]|nr:hypothetical protein [candidate division KSB1 bacterium]
MLSINYDKISQRILILVFSFFLSCSQCSNHREQPVIVAFVNGEPVTIEEFQDRMVSHRAEVVQYYRQTAGATYNADFWYTEFNGESPVNRLLQITMQELAKIKIEQQLAREYGIVRNTNYRTFKKSWANENKRRIKAFDRGQIFYGPVQYSKDVYYRYIHSNLVIRLLDALQKDHFKPSKIEFCRWLEKQKHLTADKQQLLLFQIQSDPKKVIYQLPDSIPPALQDRFYEYLYDEFIREEMSKADVRVIHHLHKLNFTIY